MPQVVQTLEQDTLDEVIHRHLGVVNEALLEECHSLNPTLANFGPTLPYGIEVTIPDAPTDGENISRTVKLYD